MSTDSLNRLLSGSKLMKLFRYASLSRGDPAQRFQPPNNRPIDDPAWFQRPRYFSVPLLVISGTNIGVRLRQRDVAILFN